MIDHGNFYGDGVEDDCDGVDDDVDGGGGYDDDRKLDGRSDKCRPKTLCCSLCCQSRIIIFIVGIILR